MAEAQWSPALLAAVDIFSGTVGGLAQVAAGHPLDTVKATPPHSLPTTHTHTLYPSLSICTPSLFFTHTLSLSLSLPPLSLSSVLCSSVSAVASGQPSRAHILCFKTREERCKRMSSGTVWHVWHCLHTAACQAPLQ